MYRSVYLILSACSSALVGQNVAEREVKLHRVGEPVRVENEDGTYSLTIDPSDVPSEDLVRDVLTWTYVGQATLTDEPYPKEEVLRPAALEPSSPRDVLMRTTRVDSLGRMWTVSAIDDVGLYAHLEESSDSMDDSALSNDLDFVPEADIEHDGWWRPTTGPMKTFVVLRWETMHTTPTPHIGVTSLRKA